MGKERAKRMLDEGGADSSGSGGGGGGGDDTTTTILMMMQEAEETKNEAEKRKKTHAAEALIKIAEANEAKAAIQHAASILASDAPESNPARARSAIDSMQNIADLGDAQVGGSNIQTFVKDRRVFDELIAEFN